MHRRNFLKSAAAMPLGAGLGIAASRAPSRPGPLKLSCNLYSFNGPLVSGSMTLDEVLEFCSDLGFHAVDPTAYYIPGYPRPPDDSFTHRIKRRAFVLGLDISGTGVRNDFTRADPAARAADLELVRGWLRFAGRLGSPNLRVFSGAGVPAGRTEGEVTGWVVDALRRCAEMGAREGVMIALQNHADFIKTADQLIEIVRGVNSEWLTVNLDIGSFRVGDPYAQIARVIPYAATWQIKENLYVDGRETRTDLVRLMRIIRESEYRGYLPIETLGAGDPRLKVPRFLAEVRAALAATS